MLVPKIVPFHDIDMINHVDMRPMHLMKKMRRFYKKISFYIAIKNNDLPTYQLRRFIFINDK